VANTFEANLGAASLRALSNDAVFEFSFPAIRGELRPLSVLFIDSSHGLSARVGSFPWTSELAPQGRIDGLFVWEMLSYVRLQQYKIRPRSIACDLFAAYPALQFRQVVFSA
jgi:hypothetical protein